jgi:outer membrane protein OmpA-like peptidoglycan-associated protein
MLRSKSIGTMLIAGTLFIAFYVLPSMQSVYAKSKMDTMRTEVAYVAQENKASADVPAKKTTADSLALIQAASNHDDAKGKRSDAEKQLLSTGQMLLDSVYFKAGKTILSSNSKPYLKSIGKMLLKYPKLLIEVGGYTDNTGDSEYNIDLSKGRAESVRDYLTKVAPGLSANLSARGYGMRLPKADNRTKEGRLSNWRLQLRVINTYALQEFYSQR